MEGKKGSGCLEGMMMYDWSGRDETRRFDS